MTRYLNTLSDLEAYLRENGLELHVAYVLDQWWASVSSDEEEQSARRAYEEPEWVRGYGATMLEAVQNAITGWESR